MFSFESIDTGTLSLGILLATESVIERTMLGKVHSNAIRSGHVFRHILADVHHFGHAGLRTFLAEYAAQNALFPAALRTRNEREQLVLEYRIGQIAHAEEMAAAGDSWLVREVL